MSRPQGFQELRRYLAFGSGSWKTLRTWERVQLVMTAIEIDDHVIGPVSDVFVA